MKAGQKTVKHGLRYHKLYHVWSDLKTRCENVSHKNYSNYGGRGISVCDEWRDSPKLFIIWGMRNGWKAGLQIDRENNDGNYNPENCRFVTAKINSNNSRKRKDGRKYTSVRFNGIHYYVEVNINGKQIMIAGGFSNEMDAAVARDSFIINNKLGRKLNFPQPITVIPL